MCATLCSLNRRILLAYLPTYLLTVFYVLPSGVINDDDDDKYFKYIFQKYFVFCI